MPRSSATSLIVILLLLPVVALGGWEDRNKFELSDAPYGEPWMCLWHTGAYTLNLFVLEPYNASFDGGGGRYVAHISGFECKLEAFGNVQILDVRYPVPALDVGSGNDLVVGYSEPVPVAGPSFVLAEIDILIAAPSMPEKAAGAGAALSPVGCSEYSGRILISPTQRPSVPGMMAFVDADDPDDPLVGALRWGLDPEADVRTEPRPVAEEPGSWGSIKAIFR